MAAASAETAGVERIEESQSNGIVRCFASNAHRNTIKRKCQFTLSDGAVVEITAKNHSQFPFTEREIRNAIRGNEEHVGGFDDVVAIKVTGRHFRQNDRPSVDVLPLTWRSFVRTFSNPKMLTDDAVGRTMVCCQRWNDKFSEPGMAEDRVSNDEKLMYDYWLKQKGVGKPTWLTFMLTNWVFCMRCMDLRKRSICDLDNVDVHFRYHNEAWKGGVNAWSLYFSNKTYQEFLNRPELYRLADELRAILGDSECDAYVASKNDIAAVRRKQLELNPHAERVDQSQARDPNMDVTTDTSAKRTRVEATTKKPEAERDMFISSDEDI